MERERLPPRNVYFATAKDRAFTSSGCKLLDLALGGGFAHGRISNVIGDKSTGKSLLAIETATNHLRQYPKGRVFYRETESAFDREYAAALGLPIDRIDFGPHALATVEELFADLEAMVQTAQPEAPTLYIIDSLDALSDAAEMERDIAEGSYRTSKAKLMSEVFRRLNDRLSAQQVHVMVVSQIRANMSKFSFAKKWVRSGGKALDFYASQVLSLTQVATLKRTIGKTTRVTGIAVNAYVEKNKVGLPFRSAEFDIKFGYGIDSYKASLKWWDKNVGKGIDGMKLTSALTAMQDGNREVIDMVEAAVEQRWYQIERDFLPKRGKYD